MRARKRTEKTIEYNPVCDPKHMHGYKNVRWVENASRGLRLVGFADKIVRIDHKGWYTDDEGVNDVYRGVVYQLPSRGGEPQYVYGYADPCNDGCALLCFDAEMDKENAAHAADRFAEIFAEHERDYNRAWQAGRNYEELANEIIEARTEALKIAAEMRAAKKGRFEAPTICYTLRRNILALYRSIQTARAKRAELFDNFGSCDGFVE